ncbi:MAG: hypothetical protein UY05_C0016G0002 [Candidatus Peregrinibacteria bacterium GW2011_GWA2_47_7]|nr:MAG: hypothetical protein UY05_C0016G0002 [Candidatus Peregrinibacteria bacterium GW2011_GWA2_47_7]
METKNKIKKTLFLALLAVALLLAPSVANAKEECDPDSTFYDTCKAAEGEQFGHDEKGVIGGALNVAGNSIGDALGWAFGDLGGEGRLPTSFIDFQGGLQPPEGSGLAPELTRAKTAREFIVNIINFVLSFLGLLAVIMIIYGGFLYVTAGGVEEQSTKGKKSLQYAVIGILIVLMSWRNNQQ